MQLAEPHIASLLTGSWDMEQVVLVVACGAYLMQSHIAMSKYHLIVMLIMLLPRLVAT